STGDRTIEWSGTYTGNVAITGDVSVTGDISATGTVCSTSDRRVKDNIKTIENALDKVDNLRGVSYTKDGKTEVGVIAQEVEEVVPEVVQTNEAGMKSVAYGNLVGVLIESVKELKAEIEDLRSQLNSKNGDE
ncbi:MAG: tail fiber domain-containing protein, partial [Chloroflexi bacterium]|nr:tail fiber domain-containing protein [Chloroflexota bacterium]